MLVGQFHWNSSTGGGGGADDVRSPPLRQLSATPTASVTSEDDEQQDPQEQQEPGESRPPTTEREKVSSKTWLGFGKSKTSTTANSYGSVGPSAAVSPSASTVASPSSAAVDNKNRRKPRRWPSTPAFMPAGTTRPVPTITGSNSHQFIGTTSSSPSSIDHQHQQQQPCTAAADDVASSNSSGSSNSSRPQPLQPFIQGYNLTMPVSISSSDGRRSHYHHSNQQPNYQHRSIRQQQVKANRIESF